MQKRLEKREKENEYDDDDGDITLWFSGNSRVHAFFFAFPFLSGTVFVVRVGENTQQGGKEQCI